MSERDQDYRKSPTRETAAHLATHAPTVGETNDTASTAASASDSSAKKVRRTSASSGPAAGERLSDTPHVILVTETPNLNGVFPLVLHLAQLEAEHSAPVLVVDLAPAASRLVHSLGNQSSRLSHWREQVQPLWGDSSHGRSLNGWKRSGRVDLLAQLGNEFPETSQMPRICEQLVRHLAFHRSGQGESDSTNYRRVFLLSECVGLPLDRAAWQAADEVWLLHDPKQALEPVAAHLGARLAPGLHRTNQRLVLLNKVMPKLAGIAQGRRIEAVKNREDVLGGCCPHYETYNITWPLLSARLAVSLARTAREISRRILHDETRSHPNRQAS